MPRHLPMSMELDFTGDRRRSLSVNPASPLRCLAVCFFPLISLSLGDLVAPQRTCTTQPPLTSHTICFAFLKRNLNRLPATFTLQSVFQRIAMNYRREFLLLLSLFDIPIFHPIPQPHFPMICSILTSFLIFCRNICIYFLSQMSHRAGMHFIPYPWCRSNFDIRASHCIKPYLD